MRCNAEEGTEAARQLLGVPYFAALGGTAETMKRQSGREGENPPRWILLFTEAETFETGKTYEVIPATPFPSPVRAEYFIRLSVVHF